MFVEGGGRPFIGRRPLVKRGHSSREAVRRERPFIEAGEMVCQEEAIRQERPFIEGGGDRSSGGGHSLRGRSLREGETVRREEAIHREAVR